MARYTNESALLGNQDDWDPNVAIAPDGGRVLAMVTLAYDTQELAE